MGNTCAAKCVIIRVLVTCKKRKCYIGQPRLCLDDTLGLLCVAITVTSTIIVVRVHFSINQPKSQDEPCGGLLKKCACSDYMPCLFPLIFHLVSKQCMSVTKL